MKNDYSCGGSTTTVKATSVSVYPSCTTLKVGEWFYGAAATVYPSNATNKTVTWRSGNTAVATVNASSGYIYAKSQGSANIYATAADGSGKSDYLTVTVTSAAVPVNSVELNRMVMSLNIGMTVSLSATVCPENATDRSLSWSSSNAAVATVSGGCVSALAKGTAIITATANDGSGKSASCTVNVNENIQVSSVTVSPRSKIMAIGESVYLTATYLPTNATNPCIYWVSSDTSVASVNSESGLVLARGVGTATIYAAAQDGSRQKDSCSITVMESIPVRTIQICPECATMQRGESLLMNATISPANATDKNVAWHSEFPEIASVDATGNVVAHTVGTTTIYATAGDCESKTASCTIHVVVDYEHDGEFYINNKSTGKFIKYSSSALVKSIYEASILQKWYFSHIEEEQYTIRARYNSDIALYASGSSVLARTAPSALTDEYKWRVTSVSGGGVVIQNVSNDMVLYDSGTDILLTNEDISGNINNEKCIWRVIDPASYVELQSFSVSGMTVDRQQSATPVIASVSPANATWAAAEDFLYTTDSSLISIDNDNHTIKGITSGTATVTATHKSGICFATFTVKVNKNAIIIIPGIFGSELYCGGNPYFTKGAPLISTEMVDNISAMQNVWDDQSWMVKAGFITGFILVPSLRSCLLDYANALYDSLECNANGISKYSVYTKKYKPVLSADDDPNEYTVHCGINDYYKPLYNTFNNNSSIKARYDVEFFSYDWRLSNAHSASQLNTFINEAGYDKVVLVAHSMGGLVASGYMALGETQRAKVQKIFYLASPLLGCGEVVNIWYNLDFSALDKDIAPYAGLINTVLSLVTLKTDPIRKLVCNFPSIYELMPSEQYFTLAGKSYITKSSDIEPDIQEYTTYSSTMSLISDILSQFNQALMTNAEAFHVSLYLTNGLHISSLTDSYYLYGTGLDTPVTYNYHFRAYTPMVGYFLSSPVPNENTPKLGDSLVAQWSAALGGNSAYNDKIYRCLNENHSHMNIMDSNVDVRNFIRDIILENYVYAELKNFIKGYE